jgi:hypothetical protein
MSQRPAEPREVGKQAFEVGHERSCSEAAWYHFAHSCTDG